jgi:hypothetical protein
LEQGQVQIAAAGHERAAPTALLFPDKESYRVAVRGVSRKLRGTSRDGEGFRLQATRGAIATTKDDRRFDRQFVKRDIGERSRHRQDPGIAVQHGLDRRRRVQR